MNNRDFHHGALAIYNTNQSLIVPASAFDYFTKSCQASNCLRHVGMPRYSHILAYWHLALAVGNSVEHHTIGKVNSICHWRVSGPLAVIVFKVTIAVAFAATPISWRFLRCKIKCGRINVVGVA